MYCSSCGSTGWPARRAICSIPWRQAAAKCSVHQIGDPQDVAGCPYKPDAVSQFSAGVRDRKWRDFPATRSRVHGKLSPASPCRRVHRFAAHASSPRPAEVPWRGVGRHAGGQSRPVGARLKCHWPADLARRTRAKFRPRPQHLDCARAALATAFRQGRAAGWVCGAFESRDVLNFIHHREVAALAPIAGGGLVIFAVPQYGAGADPREPCGSIATSAAMRRDRRAAHDQAPAAARLSTCKGNLNASPNTS